MDQRLQLFSQTVGCLGDSHPPPSSDFVLEPVFELARHPHEVDIDAAQVIAFHVVIPADRPARDDPAESRFLLGLTDRRLTRPFSIVNRPLGKNPTFAGGRRDQRNLDALLPDSIRNHSRLVMYTRHPSSVTLVQELCAVNLSVVVKSGFGLLRNRTKLARRVQGPARVRRQRLHLLRYFPARLDQIRHEPRIGVEGAFVLGPFRMSWHFDSTRQTSGSRPRVSGSS
jgi:hypothetical protein